MFSGFDHKLLLLLLLKLIADHLSEFSTELDVFNTFSDQLKKNYIFIIFIKP